MRVPSLILIKYSPAKPPRRTDAITVAHNQHANHQLQVDRRPPDIAVKKCQLVVQIGRGSGHKAVDPPQQVILRHAILKRNP